MGRVGLWESHQRPEGAGRRPFFGEAPSQGRRRPPAPAGRRWKHSWALFAETRGLLLCMGLVRVRLPSTSYPEGKGVGPASLVRMPFGDPLSLRGRRRWLGSPSGVN